MAICAAILSAFLLTPQHDNEDHQWNEEHEDRDPWWHAVVISSVCLSAMASLASCGSSIVLQKDWIVVVAGGDANGLASKFVANPKIWRFILCLHILPAVILFLHVFLL